jgi:hypothetical protein
VEQAVPDENLIKTIIIVFFKALFFQMRKQGFFIIYSFGGDVSPPASAAYGVLSTPLSWVRPGTSFCKIHTFVGRTHEQLQIRKNEPRKNMVFYCLYHLSNTFY